jgi:hypothetical protein
MAEFYENGNEPSIKKTSWSPDHLQNSQERFVAYSGLKLYMCVKTASGDVFSECGEGCLDTILFEYIYGAEFL